jgi:hypothetical protein
MAADINVASYNIRRPSSCSTPIAVWLGAELGDTDMDGEEVGKLDEGEDVGALDEGEEVGTLDGSGVGATTGKARGRYSSPAQYRESWSLALVVQMIGSKGGATGAYSDKAPTRHPVGSSIHSICMGPKRLSLPTRIGAPTNAALR